MSRSPSVLIVEDEADLAEVLRYNLTREGYACRVARGGDVALKEVEREAPDLILLDRMLPGISGDEVATRLKRNEATASIPIIMLTAKSEETDELVGFALGADDYVTKPFSPRILIARVASMLRRSAEDAPEGRVFAEGPVRLDQARHEVTVDAAPVLLTATEFKLLLALMAARGRVLSRAQLIDRAIGEDVVVTERTIDVHMTGLRKKLGAEAAAWVGTIRGVGYTFRSPGDESTP
jgi:two-component system phosphate regulon response regulator PhoB